MGETSKARSRREKLGWYNDYIVSPGLDIGGFVDRVSEKFDLWDLMNDPSQDAQDLSVIANEKYQTVYASHVLEHVDDPVKAVKEWWRVLRRGGNLIVIVPHMSLYEKKEELPSQWNPEHKTFWLPSSKTKNVRCLDAVIRAGIFDMTEDDNLSPDQLELYSRMRKHFQVVDDGYDYSLPSNVHPVGEYSIEIVINKL